MLRESLRAAIVVGLAFALLGPVSWAATGSSPTPSKPNLSFRVPESRDIPATFGHFIENAGQVRNERVLFYVAAGGIQFGFEERGIAFVMLARTPSPATWESPRDSGNPEETSSRLQGLLVRASFEGANRVQPQGRDALPYRSHYYLGNNPAEWRTDVRSYAEILYENLYDGIDLAYRLTDAGVKYEFRVQPGADPGSIYVRFEGIRDLGREGTDLVVRTELGDLRDSGLHAYQDGHDVPCAFVVRTPRSYGFRCSAWDASRTLVIDPLLYATFLGGAGADFPSSIAVDAEGNAYVVGATRSTDFPVTPGSFDMIPEGALEGFVFKLNASGSQPIYGAFLGGDLDDAPQSIVVDSAGNAYVTGYTFSNNFPTTPGAYDTSHNGNTDAFVAKINSTGSLLIYSTFLGGALPGDVGYGIALTLAGEACVTGNGGEGFPTTPGAFDTSYNGNGDAFVTKLNYSGSGLLYSTFLGGTGIELGRSIAVDDGGDAYVAGYTTSVDFPTTPGAFDSTFNGVYDGFATKVNPLGTTLTYSTYLGRSGFDIATSLASDSAGNAYIAGYTDSNDFPTTAGAFDTSYNGNGDAFVMKLNPVGTDRVYATYLGGTADEGAYTTSIRIDAAGDAYVAGSTASADFPTVMGANDTSYNGGSDAFAARFDDRGSVLVYSTFLGGSAEDIAFAVAVDTTDHAYVTGRTASGDFPATSGAFDTSHNGNYDGFVAKFDTTAYSITVQTAPGGLRISVDGNTYDAPHIFWCLAGSSHALEAPSPQIAGSTRHLFLEWSDGEGSPRTIRCDAPRTYTANYMTEYQITVATSPTGLLVQADGNGFAAPHALWCTPGSSHELNTSTPQVVGPTRHFFASWSDGGARSHSITCASPSTITAVFSSEYNVTVATSPPSLQVVVDGGTFPAPYSFWCGAGTSHVIDTITPQDDGTTRYAFDSWSDGGARQHAINCDTPGGTYTGSFVATAFRVTVTTSPSGLLLLVNGSSVTAPYTFWCPAGSTHTLEAPSPQVTGSTRFVFASWSNGGTRSHTIRCDAPATHEATFSTEYEVTVDTSPSGLEVDLDGTAHFAPFAFWCPDGSSHILSAISPQGTGPTRSVFSAWSDGGLESHTIICGGPAAYTASFSQGHEVSVATQPGSLVVVVDGNPLTAPQTFFWIEGSSHALDVPSPQGTGSTRYVFSSWSDGGAKNHVVTIVAPAEYAVTFDIASLVSVSSAPEGLEVTVDGNTLSTPQTFWWRPGSSHTLGTASPQAFAGKTYEFAAWSDSGAQSHTVTAGAPTSYVATFIEVAKDFSLFASPPQAVGVPGGSLMFTVSVAGLNDYDGPPIAVSVPNPPAGFSALCSPSSVPPSGTCRLTAEVQGYVAPGTYLLMILGDNGTAVRDAAVRVLITGDVGPGGGLPPDVWIWLALGAVAMAVVASLLVLRWRRRQRQAEPGSRPSEDRELPPPP